MSTRRKPSETDGVFRPVRLAVRRVFEALDYEGLGSIYCEEGGKLFWKARRRPCQRLGLQLASVLVKRLRPHGRSLYVGMGVAELPILAMETVALLRDVQAFTLRRAEASILTAACEAAAIPVSIQAKDAAHGTGRFDHVWIVSILNDPERFPELSALSYGRADPARFDASAFSRQQRAVRILVESCLKKLALPGLVTTSVEEIPWITDWCERRGCCFTVEAEDYPTAIVGDPVCLIRITRNGRRQTQ